MKYLIMAVGLLIGGWALASMVSGVMLAGGITPLLASYAVAMSPTATMVGSYSSLKGVEYLIVLAFLVAFTVFSGYLNTEEPEELVLAKA